MKAIAVIVGIVLAAVVYFGGWFGLSPNLTASWFGQGLPPVVQAASEAASGGAATTNSSGGLVAANGDAIPGYVDVDESALRFFARSGDTRRLDAEIARLRAIYPDWTPPSDPANAAVRDRQLDGMWALFKDEKFGALREAIEARRKAEPEWQVPADLVEQLTVAETRLKLVAASNAKDYAKVVGIAAGNPRLLTCTNIDSLWRVAEAFANTNRLPRARDAYVYILTNCDAVAERLATVQKASLVLPREDLEALFAKERRGSDGSGEFASVRGDIARQAIAASNLDPQAVVFESDVKTLEELADRDGKAADEMLLGWHYIRHKTPQRAERWFRKAYDKGETGETAQGLALALVDLKRPAEAEAVLYDWRDENDDIKAVYLAAVANLLAADPVRPIDERILARIVPVIYEARDAASGQELGWYADAMNQFQTAAQWFTTVLGWKPDDEPSAYGLALMRWKLGDMAGVQEVQRAWAGRSERIAIVGQPEPKTPRAGETLAPAPVQKSAPVATATPAIDPVTSSSTTPEAAAPAVDATATTRSIASAPAGKPVRRDRAARHSSGCTTTISPRSLSPEQALQRGWCLMELNRPAEAAAAFEVGLESAAPATRRDSAYGQSLAYMRLGLGDEAAVAATKAPLDQARSIELQTALLAAQATSAFEARRYNETLMALDELERIAAPRVDLMVLRGYAYLKLKRTGDAERVFKAAAATGDHAARKALGQLRSAPDPARD